MKKLFTLVALLLAFTASQCFAQDLKIGIIDMNQILQKAPLMTSLNNDLLKRFQPRQNELATAQKQLQDDTNNFNLNGASMSADDRTKAQNKILTEQANVQILTANLQRDLAIAKDEALRKFMSKLNSVVGKIALDEKYDLIEQNTNFAFVNTRLDITQQILKQMQ
jgi:outer membrane protein